MSLRLIQIVLAADLSEDLAAVLDDASPPDRWHTDLDDGFRLTTVIIRSQAVEPLSDKLQERFGEEDGFRLVLLPVEATHPKLPDPDESDQNGVPSDGEEDPKWSPRFGRVSREELEEDIRGSAKTGPVFLIMVALATLVACVGLVKNSPAIIIGAMVIAPLLGPNTALALGTTLGDLKLIRSAVRSNLIGLAQALAMAAVFGLVMEVDPTIGEIQARTAVDLGDILVALCSGAAGAIAFTTGAPAAIVGVMVAVALLPPTAACGMLLGDGNWADAGRAAILAATNIVCINLSAMAVLLVQGVRPTAWYEKDRARAASVRALVIWTVMLVLLGVLIVLAKSKGEDLSEAEQPAQSSPLSSL
ncbi:MAG: TIGR00341 family protein [Planctomycetota bacterium]|nr:MAG: TIGR00341 family protein [Planctomycetota bacterium]